MKKRTTVVYSVIAALIVFVGLTPLAANASDLPSRELQGEPTATPNDPIWLAFVAARTALEEKTGEDLTWVRFWTYEQSEWKDGIDSCRTLGEEEEARQLYFGWTFVFTTLNNRQYEVRTSFNYKLIAICDQVTQAAAAPQGTPNPNLPAPVTGSAVSGSFEVGGQVTGLYPNTRNALSAARMKWVKLQLQYGQSAQGLIAEAHGAGYKILLSVKGDGAQAMNSGYQDQFAQYVAGLAAAGADAIEIWNEPNLDREWPTGQINGANYVPLLAKAYNAIKTTNPNTMVISAALSPTGAAGSAGCTANYCNDDVYAQQMAAAGAANYADCIGVHYNEGVISPRLSSGDPRDNYNPAGHGIRGARSRRRHTPKCYTDFRC